MPTLFQRLLTGIRAYMTQLQRFSRNARLVLLASFLTGLSTGGFRLLFNFYALSLEQGIDEAFLGTLQTLQSLAAILAALPVAYIAGRFAHKPLLIGISLVSSFSLLSVVLFPFSGALIAARMLFGVAFAAREVVVAPFLLANTQDGERQWVFSFNLGLTMTAVFVGNTLGGNLPTLYANLVGVDPTSAEAYQFAVALLSLMAASAVIPLSFLRMSESGATQTRELPWHLLRKHGRALLPFLLPNLIVGLGAGLMQPFMNLYFRTVYAQPDNTISLIFALGGISMAIAQFAAPPLADRYGKINTVMLSQALSVPFLLLLALGAFLVPGGYIGAGAYVIVAAVAYNVRLGLMNMGNPVYQTFMLERVPEKVSALAVSLSSISFQFGWFVMPQVSGAWQVRYGAQGFVLIFVTVALFYSLAVAMEWVFFKRGKRNAPQAQPVGD